MKKLLKGIAVLLAAAILAVGGYAAYLLLDYSRIADYQELICVERNSDALRAGEELSIVSWNLGFGAYNADFSFFMDGGIHSRAYSRETCEENIRSAIQTLHAQNADLMLLQEVDVQGTRSHGVNQVAMLEEAFADSHSSAYAQNYDSSYLLYPFHEPIGANRGGILTLAQAQISGAVRRSLPIEAGLRKFFDLDRCYSVSSIPVDNSRQLMLYNLHLSAYTADGSIATEQLRLLLADMQAAYSEGNYVIAGGDFNKDLLGDSSQYTGISGEEYTWAQPFPEELLGGNFSLVNSCNAESPVLSCRDTGVPYEKGSSYEVTLDGFIISDNISLLNCGVLDEGFSVSDHNPVRMEFVLEA